MKKCPFCKADIEDNARFCLYCMKPLNEKEIISPPQKKKQWWWLFAVVFVVLALVLLIPSNTDLPQQEQTPPSQTPVPEPICDTTTLPQTQEPESAQGYTYRLAQAGDEYSAHYTNTDNDIVITGVQKNTADGVYKIPDYIDGKRVITIDANAFYGSNVRVLYLPETVRYIKTYAFNGCQVTDIYFTQNIYISDLPDLENGEYVVLHCPRDCQDRNHRYYSSFAGYPELYGATWEEWNG